jgi:hypothetical protein
VYLSLFIVLSISHKRCGKGACLGSSRQLCARCLLLLQFNSVTILSILIDSNQSDADTTKVLKISFAGQAGDTFNVAEIKKQEEQG